MKKRQDKAGKSAKCGLNALLRLILISCSAAQQRHTQLEAVQLAMLHVQQSRQVNAVAVATAVLCSALLVMKMKLTLLALPQAQADKMMTMTMVHIMRIISQHQYQYQHQHQDKAQNQNQCQVLGFPTPFHPLCRKRHSV